MIARLAGLVMLANVILLAGVGWGLASNWARWTSDPALPAAAAAVDPTVHLPLSGMPGFSGSPELACRSVEAYLLDLGAALVAAGAEPPMSFEQVRALSAEGRCSVSEPAVRQALDSYADAWAEAGLAPHAPLMAP